MVHCASADFAQPGHAEAEHHSLPCTEEPWRGTDEAAGEAVDDVAEMVRYVSVRRLYTHVYFRGSNGRRIVSADVDDGFETETNDCHDRQPQQ